MKKLLILILLVGGLVYTCPEREKHVVAIEDYVKECSAENGESALSGMITSWFASMYIDNKLVVKNYFVCSVGELKHKEEMHTISIGVLGQVFVLARYNDKKNAIQEQSFNI